MISGKLKRYLSNPPVLYAAIFVVAQLAAVAHEIEHQLDAHDEPCALHVAADQLTKAPAPPPFPTLATVPSIETAVPAIHAFVAPALRHNDARAPPSSA